jgi:hypothetical protein
MSDGVELRTTAEKGDGIFATRSFHVGETVMVGRIDDELDHNHPHASQIGEHRFVLHGGLVPQVNHSCEPNCGIHLNSGGAHDLIARQPIEPDEKIAFDYAMRNYLVEQFPAECDAAHAAAVTASAAGGTCPPSAKTTTAAMSRSRPTSLTSTIGDTPPSPTKNEPCEHPRSS